MDLADPHDTLRPDSNSAATGRKFSVIRLGILAVPRCEIQFAVRRFARAAEAVGEGEADGVENLVVAEHD